MLWLRDVWSTPLLVGRQLGKAPYLVPGQKWGILMARYFFRADYPSVSVNDNVGEEFLTLQDAEDHAAIVADELTRNRTQSVVVSVLSENGILLATVTRPSDTLSSRHASGGRSNCQAAAVPRTRVISR